MKRLFAILLAALMLPAFASAEVTANAVAQCCDVYQLTAPYSGVLKPFDWQSGEMVGEGETLFEMETLKVCAPVDGVVRALFAEPGDQAASVMGLYGMLAAIEKENPLVINASTDGAYNKAENKLVHVGETVYVEEVNDRDNEGEGRIIAVEGKNFVVEVLSGEFDDNVSMEVFRSEGHESKSRIGSGRSDVMAEIPVSGAGVVLRSSVKEGDFVRKGGLLYELAYQDADNTLRSPALTAPAQGAIELAVPSGMQVYKGQLLAKIHDLSAMEVVASVDEMDLDLAAVGNTVRVVFDRYPDAEMTGTVTSVSRIGMPKQNATYYSVTVSVETDLEILPGMNAVVYLD